MTGLHIVPSAPAHPEERLSPPKARLEGGIVPRALSVEDRLECLFDEMDRLAQAQHEVAVKIDRARREWADEQGLITPPRVESLRRMFGPRP